MVQKIGHMQVRHVLIVTLTVSEVMHTRIMAVLIDRVQIVEKDYYTTSGQDTTCKQCTNKPSDPKAHYKD